MMPFRIRIRENDCLSDGQHYLPTRIVFSHLKIGQSELLKRKKVLWVHRVYVGALRLEDNSLLTVIAPSYTPLCPFAVTTARKMNCVVTQYFRFLVYDNDYHYLA